MLRGGRREGGEEQRRPVVPDIKPMYLMFIGTSMKIDGAKQSQHISKNSFAFEATNVSAFPLAKDQGVRLEPVYYVESVPMPRANWM